MNKCEMCPGGSWLCSQEDDGPEDDDVSASDEGRAVAKSYEGGNSTISLAGEDEAVLLSRTMMM